MTIANLTVHGRHEMISDTLDALRARARSVFNVELLTLLIEEDDIMAVCTYLTSQMPTKTARCLGVWPSQRRG